MARWLAALGVLAASLVLAGSASAMPFEAQGWKTQDQHIHGSFDAPMLGTLSAPRDLSVTLLLHNNPGNFHVSFLDVQDGSNTMAKVPLNVYGTGASEQRIPVTIRLDPAKFSNSGWRELRVRGNIDKPDREFFTTRICVFVANGKARSDYCGGPTVRGRCGAGAWYPDLASNYRIVFVDCRDVAKAQSGSYRAGDKIRVKFQDGQGFANIDPAFHAGNPGVVVGSNLPANSWTTVTIPPGLAPGPHKLHLRSQTGVEAGAYVLSFNAA